MSAVMRGRGIVPGVVEAEALVMGTAPAAMVISVMTTKAALGAIVTRVPTVIAASPDPVHTIRTGDIVRVDGDAGTVTIVARAAQADPAAS
jgi:hypothetical protein